MTVALISMVHCSAVINGAKSVLLAELLANICYLIVKWNLGGHKIHPYSDASRGERNIIIY